jgi:hypothetical protein
MSDDDRTDETETEAPVVAPAVPDSFREVAALLTLVTETRACKARLRELRQAAALADKARAELTAARVEHDAFVAKQLKEMAEQTEELHKRELKVHAAEGMLENREKVCDDREANLDLRSRRFETLPGGMVREFPAGQPTGDEPEDAHYTPVPDPTFAPARGLTLTRESELVRRPRRVSEA